MSEDRTDMIRLYAYSDVSLLPDLKPVGFKHISYDTGDDEVHVHVPEDRVNRDISKIEFSIKLDDRGLQQMLRMSERLAAWIDCRSYPPRYLWRREIWRRQRANRRARRLAKTKKGITK